MKKASLTPAHQAAFEWARQRLYQRVGLALVLAMTEDGVTFDDLAARLKTKPQVVRKIVFNLLDGKARGETLGRMAAVACAMDRVWDVSLLHIETNYTQEFPDEQ